MYQRTIKTHKRISGITLHSGKKSVVDFIPANENTGIVFVRNGTYIDALATNVVSTELSTVLHHAGESVGTIEHLMCAISVLMIDNLIIHVSGDEIPILDGSAFPFLMTLNEAGVIEQNEKKKFFTIEKTIKVAQNEKFAMLVPFHGIKYRLGIEFNHPVIDENPNIEYEHGENFTHAISRARTFGFIHQVEQLHAKGLALGASVQNAIVLDSHSIVNDEGLRYSDEFVKHKLIDAIGDLRLLGSNFIGQFIGYKTGHALNNLLAREVLRQAIQKKYFHHKNFIDYTVFQNA
jgi:UDP-3-O-[3-hydroxymyristoyl] N-acetylglucosamine deacetylase